MTRGIIDTVSDADLLRAGARGDGDAFATLFQRHQRYLWAIALRTTGDTDDAADALQEAYVSIIRTAAGFRADSSVQCWMHRIVVNSGLDRIRRRRYHDTSPLPLWDDEAPDRGAKDFTEAIDLRLSIGRALDVLPAGQREAIVAVDIEGRTIDETASLLGVAVGTVKSRCARGRLKLALVLGHLKTDDC
ncbi:RNA polymerase ECF-type sigma factor SigM [Gordonia hirsuta DSM 44140 = NBRC 16056]|uniref:RNA polymerase ECF-type sigma factor SigM n=1 Tax=Gordonia hirsuta DSM 44140 = NBRC 16056 TaxID=1121927 RepID=L7L852_9ACTN|nr:RNA polymerase sigma factor SigM [Gordonia hirsuta]GAC56926.1 RNA polymerase ECF-type sigma factor SigM [Gordonia hirsuta DSM 44140 = NBRC 16056]